MLIKIFLDTIFLLYVLFAINNFFNALRNYYIYPRLVNRIFSFRNKPLIFLQLFLLSITYPIFLLIPKFRNDIRRITSTPVMFMRTNNSNTENAPLILYNTREDKKYYKKSENNYGLRYSSAFELNSFDNFDTLKNTFSFMLIFISCLLLAKNMFTIPNSTNSFLIIKEIVPEAFTIISVYMLFLFVNIHKIIFRGKNLDDIITPGEMLGYICFSGFMTFVLSIGFPISLSVFLVLPVICNISTMKEWKFLPSTHCVPGPCVHKVLYDRNEFYHELQEKKGEDGKSDITYHSPIFL